MKCALLDGDSVLIDLDELEGKGLFSPDGEVNLSCPGAMRRLSALLKEAGAALGIDLSGGKVRVRAYTHAEGGFRLYIRCETGKNALCRAAAADLLRLKTVLHRFDEQIKTTLYLGPEGEGYLRVEGAIPPMLAEFGQVLSVNPALAEAFLYEHCTPILTEEAR